MVSSEVEKAFNKWIQENANISDSELVAIDGKGLRNTVSDYDTPEQNFVSCVSAFSHQKG